MAPAIPAKLKAADIPRFALRASQLQNFRPIVSYWCEYYILQQVLSNGLHTADDECSEYAITLMDKLEKCKQENASNDAIVDDVAAKAYIENFALETFDRADAAQRNNSVNKQTADTFQAAATFLDLLSIWGTLEVEPAAKSKFAKFHALRIMRAVKAGQDPNETNPVIESPPTKQVDDEGLEAELEALERAAPNTSQVVHQPYIESVAEDDHNAHHDIPSTSVDHLSRPSPGESAASYYQDAKHGVSPVVENYELHSDDPTLDRVSRTASPEAGYFPAVPAPPKVDREITVLPQHVKTPPPPALHTIQSHDNPPIPPPPSDVETLMPQHVPPATLAPVPVASSAVVPTRSQPRNAYNTDDESIMNAQKHAKWAISALNFEDVNTAVKELRLALQSLGAD